MKTKAFVCLVLAVVFQLHVLALVAPKATFSCGKANSDVALMLAVTNNGPDTVPKGTKVYFFYKTSQAATPVYGSYTIDHEFKKGDSFDMLINSAWQTPIVSCGVSLKPYLKKVIPIKKTGE